jgi:hypothetical protein
MFQKNLRTSRLPLTVPSLRRARYFDVGLDLFQEDHDH